jgi:hypothetical protein
MIEIDGLKIDLQEKSKQICVEFPDGSWTGNLNEVSNILLFEILKRIARPFPVVYDPPIPIPARRGRKPKKND